MIIDLAQYQPNLFTTFWLPLIICLVVIGVVWAMLAVHVSRNEESDTERHAQFVLLFLIALTCAGVSVFVMLFSADKRESSWIVEQVHETTNVKLSPHDLPNKGKPSIINNVAAIEDGIGVKYDSITLTRQANVIIIELSEGKTVLPVAP